MQEKGPANYKLACVSRPMTKQMRCCWTVTTVGLQDSGESGIVTVYHDLIELP